MGWMMLNEYAAYVRDLLKTKDMSWVPRRSCREMQEFEAMGDPLAISRRAVSSEEGNEGGGGSGGKDDATGSGGGGNGKDGRQDSEVDYSLIYDNLQRLQERMSQLQENMQAIQAKMESSSNHPFSRSGSLS